jgi:hypothetical protein
MRLLLLIGLLFISVTLRGELAEKEGYYITMDGDTVTGILKVRIDYLGEPYFARIQYGVFFEDSINGLVSLRPDSIQRFSFFHQYEWHNFVSQEYYKGFRLFLKVLIEGDGVCLYSHFRQVVDTRTDFGNLAYYLLEYPSSSERDAFFLVKVSGETLKYNKYSGKKNISLFFADCPLLHRKIQRGLYGYTAVYKMVREYNVWYAEGAGDF